MARGELASAIQQIASILQLTIEPGVHYDPGVVSEAARDSTVALLAHIESPSFHETEGWQDLMSANFAAPVVNLLARSLSESGQGSADVVQDEANEPQSPMVIADPIVPSSSLEASHPPPAKRVRSEGQTRSRGPSRAASSVAALPFAETSISRSASGAGTSGVTFDDGGAVAGPSSQPSKTNKRKRTGSQAKSTRKKW